MEIKRRMISADILLQNVGRIVEVKLGVGKSVSGKLKWFDEHTNLVLEVSDGEKTSFTFIRGGNVVQLNGLVFNMEAFRDEKGFRSRGV